jgi:hypothetical protein
LLGRRAHLKGKLDSGQNSLFIMQEHQGKDLDDLFIAPGVFE